MSALTPEPAATTARPVLRSVDDCPSLLLLPVPVSEPPYDDEPVEGRHLRAVDPAALRPATGPLRELVPLRLVPPPVEPARLPPSGPVLPPVRPVARALVQGLLEVLAGVRPVTQLRRSTSVELYDELETRVHALPRTTGHRPPTSAVRGLHVQQPTAGVAEVCATVLRGRRAAALALRLEHRDGHWCCTAVAGLPGDDLPS